MGVLVISEELGSSGDEVGRAVAGRSGYCYVSAMILSSTPKGISGRRRRT